MCRGGGLSLVVGYSIGESRLYSNIHEKGLGESVPLPQSNQVEYQLEEYSEAEKLSIIIISPRLVLRL